MPNVAIKISLTRVFISKIVHPQLDGLLIRCLLRLVQSWDLILWEAEVRVVLKLLQLLTRVLIVEFELSRRFWLMAHFIQGVSMFHHVLWADGGTYNLMVGNRRGLHLSAGGELWTHVDSWTVHRLKDRCGWWAAVLLLRYGLRRFLSFGEHVSYYWSTRIIRNTWQRQVFIEKWDEIIWKSLLCRYFASCW